MARIVLITGILHNSHGACNPPAKSEIEVKVTHIKFDHKTGSNKDSDAGPETVLTDGLNILRGYDDDFGHRDYR